MRRESACIFCRIVAREAPAAWVCEDATTAVFLDHAPVSPGHTMVVTREHFTNMFEASEEALRAVMATAHRVAPALCRVVEPAGLRVIQLNGAAAGQTVFHYHLHLIPCAEDGAMQVHGRGTVDLAERETLAAAIRRELES